MKKNEAEMIAINRLDLAIFGVASETTLRGWKVLEMKSEATVCYLCGNELGPKTTSDHVPMKQIFAKAVRRQHNPNLVTLPTHKICNHEYQHDEDYFVNSLLPLACDTYAGQSVLEDAVKRKNEGQGLGLIRKVIGEATKHPSGLVLPRGKIAKRFEGDRISRIAWKIIRGLFFYETAEFLPESTPNTITLVPPGDKPPEVFFALASAENRGSYPGVFDYRHIEVEEMNNFNLWSFLLWDKLIFLCGFHHPQCQCDKCNQEIGGD